MDTWQVIAALLSLISGVAIVVRPMLKLTESITKLTTTVENIDQRFAESEEHGKESRRRLWEHNEKQDDILADHEGRLRNIEGGKRYER